MSGKTVNKRELAEILGVTERALTLWQKQGMPMQQADVRGAENAYNSAAVVAWMVERATRKVKQKAKFESPRDRLSNLQADRIAMELAEKRGETLTREEARPLWLDLMAGLKQDLLALPAGLAPLLDQMEGVDPKRDLLEDAINNALARLSSDEIEQDIQPGSAGAGSRSAGTTRATGANAAVGMGGAGPEDARGVADAGAVSMDSRPVLRRGRERGARQERKADRVPQVGADRMD